MTTYRSRRASLVTFLILLTFFLVFNVHMMRSYLLALFMGAVFALLSSPVYRRLLRSGAGPKTSASLVTSGVVLLLVIPVFGFATVAIREGIVLGQSLADREDLSLNAVTSKLSRVPAVRSVLGNATALREQARSAIRTLVRDGSGFIVALAADIPNRLLQLALAGLACFFFLIDGPRLLVWLSNKIPLDRDVWDRLLGSVEATTISVIWANVAAAGVQALIMLLAYWMLGVPGAFLAGGATFILAWVPMVGSVPVWLVGAVVLYFQQDIARMAAMLAFGVMTGVADNFVRPVVLKGKGDMHPLYSLVAIFGGIQMFGILGVFVGPIVAAVLVSLLEIWPTVERRSGIPATTEDVSS